MNKINVHDKDFANKILENAGALIVVLDHEGRILSFNRACEKLSGYTFSEVKGKFPWEVLLPAEDADVLRSYTLATLGKHALQAPAINVHPWLGKDNKRHLLEWSNTLVHDAKGKVECLVSVGTDITEHNTERHRAEDALRDSEQRFHNLADQAPIMIGMTDETGHITFLNKTWLDFRGKTLEEEEGWAWAAGLHPEDRERTLAEMEACIGQHQPYSIEYRIEDSHGQYHWLLDTAAPRYDGQGKPCGYIGTATNINERKEAELALADSEERYRTIVETAQEGIWVIDSDNNTSFVNPKMAEILGYSVADMQGRSMFDFMDEEGHKIAADNVERRKQGIAEQHLFKFKHKNGASVWTELNANPMFDRHGSYMGALAMITDITERKMAEDNLRDASLLNTRIIEESPVGMAIYDSSGHCIEANRSVARIIGASREQMLKQNYHDIQPFKECGVYEQINRAIEGNEIIHFSAPIDTTFGKHLHLDFQIVPFVSRDQPHLLLMAADISERVRLEESTIKLTERLELATRAAHIGIFDWNIVDNELIWDDSMFELYGVQKEKFSGAYEAWVAGLHPEDREYAEYAVQQSLTNKLPFDSEFRICLPDGTIRHIKANGQAVWDQQGRPLRMLGVNYDITEQHLAREALNEGDKHFRALFDQSSFGVAKIDSSTGRFVKVNQRYSELVGYSMDEMLTMDFHSITFADDLQADLDNMQRLLAGEISTFQMEKRYRCKDGSIVWVNLSVLPLWSQGKTPDFHLAIVEDITRRKQMATALQESEVLLEKAQQLTHIGHWKLNLATNEVTGSDELFRIFGLIEDEVTLDAFVEVVHPDDRERDIAAIQRGAELGESWDIEHRLLCRDGTEKWVHALGEANVDKDGKVIELIGTVQDISDYKYTDIELGRHRTHLEELVQTRTAELERKVFEHARAEEALRESEQRLHAIMDTAVEGIITINHTGIVESFNAAAETLFGYTSQEIIGKNINMLMFDADRQEHDHYIETYRQTGKSNVIGTLREVEGRHKDGTPVQLELSVSELKIGDRSIFTGILHDITERKQKDNALRQATINAEQANKAKSAFLASMSHELRTPMNAILGFGQLLAFDPKNPLAPSQQECVDQIMAGGEHLLELINDILDLAKIEAGKVRLSIEPIQVTPLLDKCFSLVQTLAQARKIQLIRNYEDADYVISADYTRTQQVILNLLSNAIKYNRTGGSVTIDCQETPDNMLNIRITDTGHGIPLNKRDELFQPFSRLGVETSNIEGTGIGLTVSMNLVEMMGGEIGFDSEVEKGSTFRIKLPLMDQQQHETAASTLFQAAGGTETISTGITGCMLYVEDNPANLRLMQTLISRIAGLNLVTATNAEDGIEIARTEQPDLIILDINLPGMNGIEALAILNELEATRDIPVLALSASASQKEIENGLKAGFRHYLTKPLQISHTLETIKSVLTKSTLE